MSTKLLLIALSTFLCLSELANGGVMLYVHFGDTPQNPANENDLQTSLDASATSFVANYYVRLTEGSTIFAYRFSVRFDNDLLQFDSAEQDQFRPTIFVADSNLAAPTEQDQSTVAPILGFKELRRFHGYDESVLFPNSPLSPVRLEGDGF